LDEGVEGGGDEFNLGAEGGGVDGLKGGEVILWELFCEGVGRCRGVACISIGKAIKTSLPVG